MIMGENGKGFTTNVITDILFAVYQTSTPTKIAFLLFIFFLPKFTTCEYTYAH